MQKIVVNLWYDDKAEEAANFYVSLFEDAKIIRIDRYGKEGAEVAGRPEGSVLTVEFRLGGQRYIALNGGPVYSFTPATSLMVNCPNQQEVDRLWEALSEGGEKGPCGWLTDRYGLSWQIVPEELDTLLHSENPEKARRAMAAMLKMGKLDMEQIKKAMQEDG